MAIVLVASAIQLRVQQRVIEEGNRKQIGLWLRGHAKSPKDTVFVESLGYVGYFSQLKMLDFPGLCSPEVVASRRKHPEYSLASIAMVIAELHPDWLVLRANEVEGIALATAERKVPISLKDDYLMVKAFDVSGQVDKYSMLPGLDYLKYDQTYLVFKKR
jgi:hypothetical protein